LEQAELLLKNTPKDYYKILGVSRDFSENEIKKAYRTRALAHHPGKINVETHFILKQLHKISGQIKMWENTLLNMCNFFRSSLKIFG